MDLRIHLYIYVCVMYVSNSVYLHENSDFLILVLNCTYKGNSLDLSLSVYPFMLCLRGVSVSSLLDLTVKVQLVRLLCDVLPLLFSHLRMVYFVVQLEC